MSLREHSWRKLHSGNITYFPIFLLFLCIAYNGKGKQNTLWGKKIIRNLGLTIFCCHPHGIGEKNPSIILY